MVENTLQHQDSRLLTGLNPEQQRAVVTTEGPVLVVAGPGSGKTRVLTHRIAYLLEEAAVSPDRVLAVTFTNKAAREMRDRIGRLVGDETASGLVMGTFHSLGVRILRQNPGVVTEKLNLQRNFLIYDDGDQIEVAKRAIKQVGLDPKQIAPRRMLSRISAAKSQLISAQELAAEASTYDDEIVARVYREYERTLRGANAVDFDDLLSLPIRLFDEVPWLLERYQQQFQYILVDEYQDTNRVQYVMVSALSELHKNLFVVGDPDQSIYAWRQADIKNILDFKKDYPDTTEIHLEMNYRSTQRIVQAADRVIRENTSRIDRTIRTDNPEGEPISLRELSDQEHEAQFIVSEVRRLLSSGGYRAEDVAIMYRTTAQSRSIEEGFRVTNIPYRIVGGVRFYERKEVRDVLAVLRLIHNPQDRLALERVIDNLPIGRGFGPKAMETLQDWASDQRETLVDGLIAHAPNAEALMSVQRPSFSSAAASAATKIGGALQTLVTKAQTASLAELFDAIMDETGFRDTFNLTIEEDLQRWGNVLELRSDLERYDSVDPAEALAVYLEQVSLISDVDTMQDQSGGQVTLITLHSAKGLEFPVVFIAGVEEGLLPIYRAVEADAFDPTQMEEERRLFYVGITRAEKLLFLSYASSRLSYGRYQAGAPSRFLQSIPAEIVRSTVRSYRSGSFKQGRFENSARGPLASKVSTWTSSTGLDEVPKEKVEVPNYEPGQKVFHPKFGEGLVIEIFDRRNDNEVVVEFARAGRKRLMASLARMEVL